MATLKELRLRIRSVRSTQKITSAMKMVAASRLRRAQEQAEAARPYSQRMERMLGSLAANLRGMVNAPPLLAGTGKDQTHLVVVATSDRGLAGGIGIRRRMCISVRKVSFGMQTPRKNGRFPLRLSFLS
jgi:F-type H+-transporting ATPase subunit gamma